MPAWSRLPDSNSFTRLLGPTESSFYWDTVFSALQQITVEVPSSQASFFSVDNVKRTWLTLKQLNPLLGAHVHELENAEGVYFTVDETRLATPGSDEIIFRTLQSDKEVDALVHQILNGPRTLSNECVAQVWMISLPRCHHVLFHIAHYVCDGMAQNTVIRTFFDILVRAETPDIYIAKQSLESSLALLLAMEDLDPSCKYSPARQRWRLAIARVIHSMREDAMRGGHTLPRVVRPQLPAVSRTLRIHLPKQLSARIMASCRRAQITFGHALPVLSQLAHARVLHRLHARGTISEQEWEYRIKQPMHVAGPLNIRPYLNREWLERGGASCVCVAISFFRNTLPSIPVSHSESSCMKKPDFAELLSPKWFFHRCQFSKRQALAFIRHPLLTEFAKVTRPARVAKGRATALEWRQRAQGLASMSLTEDEHALPLNDEFVMSNGCSSFGNMDTLVPSVYPMKHHTNESPDPVPALRITSILHYLRCRPTECYLTSITYLGEIQLLVFADVRTYDEALVSEWLLEVSRAAEWYLGDAEAHGSLARL